MDESFRAVYSRLSAAQKGRARGAPAYSVHVNRPLGRILATLAYKAGLTPNQVTLVSAAFTLTGIALLATLTPQVGLGIAVWLLLGLGYAWDSADGQVARLRGGGSLDGEWLDHVVDAVKLISLHLAVLIGLYRFTDLDRALLLVPLGFTVVSGVTFFAMILNDLLKSARGVQSSAARGGGGTSLRSFLVLPTDYGVLCALFVLWAWTPVFLGAYTLVFAACTAFLLLALVKWFREMRALSLRDDPASAEVLMPR